VTEHNEQAMGAAPCSVCGEPSTTVLDFQGAPSEARCETHGEGWFATPMPSAPRATPAAQEDKR